MPRKIQDFARESLIKPVLVNVGRAGAANLDVLQVVEYVKQEAKMVYLLECLQKTPPPVIIFSENKNEVDDIQEYLLLKGVEAVAIHGSKTQEERQYAIKAFKSGAKDVMVASGVASKGLDFNDIQHVIIFSMPKEIEDYVHQIGRTGRSGKTGIATTFVNMNTPEQTLLDLKYLLIEAGQKYVFVFLILYCVIDLRLLQSAAVPSVYRGPSPCAGTIHLWMSGLRWSGTRNIQLSKAGRYAAQTNGISSHGRYGWILNVFRRGGMWIGWMGNGASDIRRHVHGGGILQVSVMYKYRDDQRPDLGSQQLTNDDSSSLHSCIELGAILAEPQVSFWRFDISSASEMELDRHVSNFRCWRGPKERTHLSVHRGLSHAIICNK